MQNYGDHGRATKNNKNLKLARDRKRNDKIDQSTAASKTTNK